MSASGIFRGTSAAAGRPDGAGLPQARANPESAASAVNPPSAAGADLAAVYRLSGQCLPWCVGAAVLLGATGLVVALLLAPMDTEQGEVHRIVFLHVPAAWLSLTGYALMAVAAGWGVWPGPHRLGAGQGVVMAHLVADALAPTVSMLALLALWTGAMWGKPGWGAWWVWDARLTAQGLLLLLVMGFVVLQAIDENTVRARRLGAMLVLGGVVQIPAVYLGAQGLAGMRPDAAGLLPWPVLAAGSLLGMGLMLAATAAWLAAATLCRLRSLLLEADPGAHWVQALPEVRA